MDYEFEDLADHPMSIFMEGENTISMSDKAWETWVRDVESMLGHSLDGDQEADGYSLDYAFDEFSRGMSAEEYVHIVERV